MDPAVDTYARTVYRHFVYPAGSKISRPWTIRSTPATAHSARECGRAQPTPAATLCPARKSPAQAATAQPANHPTMHLHADASTLTVRRNGLSCLET
jgi:site-specific DNA-cytosine methylase